MIAATPQNDVYATHATELTAFVHERISGPEADDLLQEVWSAYSVAQQRETIAQPRAWLYRVARNLLTDLYRRRATRPAFVDLTPALDLPQDTPAYVDPDTLAKDLDVALKLLPPKQREVFVRNELTGETLREIAADLQVPLKTVISRKGYARQRLQTLLRDTYERNQQTNRPKY